MRLLALLVLLFTPGFARAEIEIQTLQLKPQPVVMKIVNVQPGAFPDIIPVTLQELEDFVQESKSTATGKPYTMVIGGDEKLMKVSVGIPVKKKPEVPKGRDIKTTQLPGGTVLRAVHVGQYRNVHDTIREMEAYRSAHGLDLAFSPWEVHLDNVNTTNSKDLKTEIYMPVKKAKPAKAEKAAKPGKKKKG